MKIVFLTASLGSGGAERVVSELSNRLVSEGEDVEIVCLKFNDWYYKVDPRIRVTFARKEVKGGMLQELLWLRRYLTSRHPKVCIAFTEGVYCATICAMLGSGIPVIASERLDPRAMSWQRNLLKKIFLPFASHLVVQTAYIKSYFKGRVERKTSIIVNPVDEAVFHQPEVEKQNRIISVARLFPQKNQQMLISAFARVAKQYPDWNLVIFGEGPLRESLQGQIDALGLQERVSLPGRSHQVIEELNRSKLFCMSSNYEGMSNAMVEAVCVGLPVVSTRVSGTDELVEEGNNGYVVPCGDVDAMAEALSKLMGDDALRERCASHSKAMGTRFRMDAVIKKWRMTIG